jgi:hypothetical protein
LLGLVLVLAWLAASCQTGPTGDEQELADAREAIEDAEDTAAQERQRAARAEGKYEGLARAGREDVREADLVADIDLATSLLSDLQNNANAGKFDEAGPYAEALLDVLQSLKAELPAVRMSLFVRRAAHYMRVADDARAKSALMDAMSLAVTTRRDIQPLKPAVAKDIQDVEDALNQDGREKARELAHELLKKTDNTKEEVLVDRCLASVRSVKDALDREAEHVVRAELSQVDDLLKDLRYAAQTVGAGGGPETPAEEAAEPGPATPPEEEGAPEPPPEQPDEAETGGPTEEEPETPSPSATST